MKNLENLPHPLELAVPLPESDAGKSVLTRRCPIILQVAPSFVIYYFRETGKWPTEGKMALDGQHVVPRDGKWAVRRTGSDKLTKKFNTQKEAIREARKIARNQGTELYIHGRDGRIRDRDSYGQDPYPPPG